MWLIKWFISNFYVKIGRAILIIFFFPQKNMTDLEALTKTLIQVVGSLQDLLAKKSTNQSTLEPEGLKLKKTPEMTYC